MDENKKEKQISEKTNQGKRKKVPYVLSCGVIIYHLDKGKVAN